MQLYNLTLSSPSSITCSVAGQFSGTRQQEIVVCRGGTRLELLRPDTSISGKANSVFEQDAFGIVRSLGCFRLVGGTKEYLVIGSDSGRITIAELDLKANAFVIVHQETMGRSGSRRIVPGQTLAIDPKGRAAMIGSVEKSKLVYILNRDAAANLTISSPLEAHKPNAIIHSLVALDVGFENPTFAALEVDYEDADRDSSGQAALEAEKLLTYYELDLGLNHVVRKWFTPVDPTASHLIQIPGGHNQHTDRWEGPGGVLVCSEDFITYKHNTGDEQHRVLIPRRLNPLEDETQRRGIIVTASVCHRMKDSFFFLVQSEDGDLFKITIDHEDEMIKSLNIKYFDTVPVASALNILRAGFLFVAAEYGSSHLYSFQKIGDDDDLPTYRSANYTSDDATPPTFTPRPLENLLLTDELSALDPILDSKVTNCLGNDAPQIFTACGRGPRSSFKMLQHGLEVQEAVSSSLPGIPSAIWTTKLRSSDEYDTYVVLGFVNGTLILSIGETIEEVSNSGFLTSTSTLAVQQMGEDAVLQVHSKGVRHIFADRRVVEWPAPTMEDGQQTTIVAATTNSRQVVVALAPTNEIVYFEQDTDGQLNEYQERRSMGAHVSTLSIAEPSAGRQRTEHLAVGCEDQTVRVISLHPDNRLASVSIQALTAKPHSICVAEVKDVTIDRNHLTSFVHIGLKNGVLLRTVLDPISGQLSDTRSQFLGAKPVRLVPIQLANKETAVLALSSRPWLNYANQGKLLLTPLIFDALDYVWTFSAEMCPDGLIGVVGDTLRIFTIPSLGRKLHITSTPLSYTPRKVATHPSNNGVFYVVEADHRVLSPWEREERIASMAREPKPSQRGVLDLDPVEFGPVRAEATHWASCLRIVNATDASTLQKIELEENEAAFSVAVVPFANQRDAQSGEPRNYVVVASAIGTSIAPRSVKTAYLTVYEISTSDGATLTRLHRTEVEDVATALCPFQGRLLVAIGRILRIYDLGQKKLLRKCENRGFPNALTCIQTQGSRIVVGDIQQSTIYVSYKRLDNRLIIFADDILPRWTTALTMLDYDTVTAGDKFGNIFINRLEASVSKAVDEDQTGLSILHDKPYLHGAPHRVQLQAHYHVGDIVTSLHHVALAPGGRAGIVYTCLGGTVGVLIPFVSKEDSEMMASLEMQLRQEASLVNSPHGLPSLVGRDHLSHRGLYVPVKAVIDGDLCERFGYLTHQRQEALAAQLDRSPADVNKKLDDLRVATAF